MDPDGSLRYDRKRRAWYAQQGRGWRPVGKEELDGLAALALRAVGLPVWGTEIDDTIRLLRALRAGRVNDREVILQPAEGSDA